MTKDEEVYCLVHGPEESLLDSGIVCFECQHIYKSHRDLALTYWRSDGWYGTDKFRKKAYFTRFVEWVQAILTPVRYLTHIRFCPVCFHDF